MKHWISLATASAIALSVVGCDSNESNDSNNSAADVSKVQFESIETPLGDNQKSIQTSSKVTFGDVTQDITFTKLLATGAVDNGETFGLVKDYTDTPITFTDGSPYICNGTNDGVGSGLDFSSILQKNNKLYMVSQFECQVGAMYKAELEQDTTTGALSVKANSSWSCRESNESIFKDTFISFR